MRTLDRHRDDLRSRRVLRAVAAFSLVLAISVAQASDRPNVVLIIGDDIGWPYHGFADSPQTFQTKAGPVAAHDLAHTPNLDSLAARGALFTHGYNSSSVCVPSLQTLLSAAGTDPTGIQRKIAGLRATPGIGELDFRTWGPYHRTLPRELRRYGYVSWEGGKHWEGTYSDAGFDAGMAARLPDGPLSIDGVGLGRDGWDTSVCGSTATGSAPCPALAILRAFLNGTAGKPFFLWFAPALPHLPYDAPQIYRQPYAQIGLIHHDAGYLANVRWLDEVVGELMDELDRRDLLSNTLVVYVSDNGWGLGMQTKPGEGRGKGTPYDIGFRTPIIFSWPGRITPQVHDELISTADIPATILGYVQGAEIPEESQGQNLRPWIEGGAPRGRSRIVTHYAGHQVLDPPWRYVRNEQNLEELYDIEADPFEQNDLAAQHPEIASGLRAIAFQHWGEIRTPGESPKISGRVVSIANAPIPAAQLWIGHEVVSADSTGWFEVTLPPDVESVPVHRHRRAADLTWFDGTPLLSLPATMDEMYLEVRGRRIQGSVVKADGTLAGIVVDAVSGLPIAGARVRAKGINPRSTVQTFTGDDGKFSLEGLPSASYRVWVQAEGYAKQRLRSVEVGSTGIERVVLEGR